MTDSALAVALSLGVSIALVATAQEEARTFRVQAGSEAVVHVGRAGVFGFAGHDHQVVAPAGGSITVHPLDLARSEVVLEFDSAALRVTGEGEPAEDVPEVQRVMEGERVLDVARHPRIVFRSRRVTPGGRQGQWLHLAVEGDLSLHGVTRQVVVPVRVSLSDGGLTAEGETTLRQSDFGIRPVTAAGGTVRVKDTLKIAFTVQAAR